MLPMWCRALGLYLLFNYRLGSSAHPKDKNKKSPTFSYCSGSSTGARGGILASSFPNQMILQKCSQTKQLLIASERGSNKHSSPAEIRRKLHAVALTLILWLLMLNKFKTATRAGTPQRSRLLVCPTAVGVSLDQNPAQPCAAPAT